MSVKSEFPTMSTTTHTPIMLIPFDGSNYTLWKQKAKAYIIGQGWSDVVFDLAPDEFKHAEAGIKAIGNKAYSFIVNSLKDNVLGLFNDVDETAYDIWYALQSHYERETVANKHAVRQMLYNLKMGKGDDVNILISKITQYSSLLKGMKDTVSEGDMLYALFTGLSGEYNALTSTLKVNDKLTFIDAVKHVKDHCEFLKLFKDKGGMVDESANFSQGINKRKKRPNHVVPKQHKFKGQINVTDYGSNGGINKGQSVKLICSVCKKPGHDANHCYTRKKCYNCNKVGHVSKYCRAPKSNDDNDINGKSFNSGMHASDTKSNGADEFTAFGTDECLHVGDINRFNSFIVDSGATAHYVCNKDLLFDRYTPDNSLSVSTANNSQVPVASLGKALLYGEGSTSIHLNNVRYVPRFNCNLLSVSKLTDNGASVIFTKDGCHVEKDGTTVLVGQRKGDLYFISGCHDQVNYVPDIPTGVKQKLQLFHQRIGHLSYGGIKELASANAVQGFDLSISKHDIDTTDVCSGCMLGKAHRSSFKDYSLKDEAKSVLDRIYCDLSGPINLKGLTQRELIIHAVLGRPVYLSVIVDEKSRFVDGATISSKDHTSKHIVTWINQKENLLSRKLKYFHSDNGGEYVNKYLTEYFVGKGIKAETTCIETPQHNGIAERANRIIFNCVRSMLQHAKLSNVFWSEAAKTAMYLINLRLARHNKQQTPFEVFNGTKPFVQHLRVFGCDAFAYAHNTKKLDPKAIKCIFIGYDRIKENGYRLYDFENNKIIVTRDVVFKEGSFTHGRNPNDHISYDILDGAVMFDDNNFGLPQASNTKPPILPPILSPIPEVDMDHKHNSESNLRDDELEVGEVRPTPIVDPIDNIGQINNIDGRVHRSGLISGGIGYVAQDITGDNVPLSFDEAIASDDKLHWTAAINDEIKSLNANGTFTPILLSTLPRGTNVMSSKWVFKIKRDGNNKIEKYKARLVARGFTQKEGVDYNETFAPVVKYKSLRIILCLCCSLDYEITQMDVITAFLNGTLEEDVYMKVPQGYSYGNDMVVKLNKSLYGTKQAPHVWNEEVNIFIVSINFKRLVSDTCIYIRISKTNKIIILSIFVDDIILAYHKDDSKEYEVIKSLFMSKYKMKDLGNAQWILGMKISRDRKNKVLSLDQSIYVNKVLEKFGMQHCKPVSTPEATSKLAVNINKANELKDVPYDSAVGSLLYATLGTRPDITHAVNEVSKHIKSPNQEHWVAVKRILRYLKGTANKCLVFNASGIQSNCNNINLDVKVYCDADWAGDTNDRKSTTGFIVKLNGCTINWLTRKQKTISLSSAEAEYMAMSTASQEILWLNTLLKEMFSHVNVKKHIKLFVDNQAALLISKNDVYHDRTKHIDIRYHHVRECIQNGIYEVEWVSTQEQLADIFTKGLGANQFKKLCSLIM